VTQGAWLARAHRALAFIQDDATREYLLARFAAQYLPALKASRSPRAAVRAWDAFRAYLTAPATVRKPWSLSWDEAERVVEALAAALVEDDS
jgi:hypothetical protein